MSFGVGAAPVYVEVGMNRIGPYSLLAELGEGGMGSVYLGLHRGIGGFEKKVAIKCLRSELTDDDQFVRMLIDEARLTVQLTHPNIVQVIDLSEADGMHYLVMEYVEGVTVGALAGDDNPLAIDEAVHIGIEAARALAYAHRKCGSDGESLGIVHRDISGQNLLVSSEGLTKVLDFGIAKASSNRNRTQMGVLKGKLAYMSPEQALGKPLDGRSDIFSLGIVLWELCTGKRLFDGATEIQMLLQVQRCEVEPPSRVVAGFPRELEQIIMRCLTREADERYADGDRLADDLMDFLRGFQGAIHPRIRLAERVRAALKARPLRAIGQSQTASSGDKTLVEVVGETLQFEAARLVEEKQPAPQGKPRRVGKVAAVAGALVVLVASVIWFSVAREGRGPGAMVTAAMVEGQDAAEATPPTSEAAAPQRAGDDIPEGVEPSTHGTSSATAISGSTTLGENPTVQRDAGPVVDGVAKGTVAAPTEIATSAVPVQKPEAARLSTGGNEAGGIREEYARDSERTDRRTGSSAVQARPARQIVPAPSPVPARSTGFNVPSKKVERPKKKAENVATKAAPAKSGFLSVNASPWARVYIDGKKVADSTPLIRHSLPPGKYRIVFVNPDLPARKTVEVDVAAGEHVRQTVQLP